MTASAGPGDAHASAAPSSTPSDRALLDAVLDAVSLVVVTTDRDLVVTRAEGSIFGYEAHDIVGRRLRDLLRDDPARRNLLERALSGETVASRYQWRDRWWEVTRLPNRDDAGVVGGLTIVAVDITERVEGEDAIAAGHARSRALFHHAGVGQFIATLDGKFLEVNPAFCELLGYPSAELLDMSSGDMLHTDDVEHVMEHFARLAAGETDFADVDMRLVHRNGDVLHVAMSISLVRDAQSRPDYLTALVQDVTDRRRAQAELNRLALHDSVTGLANRTLMIDRILLALQRQRRQGRAVAVLFLDLDGFKTVNDSLGHRAGDRLLRMVGERIGGAVRGGDTVARFGGDEFAVLCEGLVATQEAVDVAARISAALAPPFELDGSQVFVTASIGIALTPANDAESLLQNADAAMYRAKERGRARYELFDEALREAALLRLRLLADLREAVDRDEFRLLFQPIVDLSSGAVVSMEALLRWEHPVRGLLSPSEFIDATEDTGLIDRVGRWALSEATREAAGWRARFGESAPTVSVNVSARQLASVELVGHVEAALAQSGLPPEALVLEVAEPAVMQDVSAALRDLRHLRRLGVHLAIDDFGTGSSSLAYLKELPVDEIKIDGTFVSGLDADPENRAIVASVIGLAHAVGLLATAERVETPTQLASLRRLGCDRAQGFLVSTPIGPGGVERLLEHQTPMGDGQGVSSAGTVVLEP